MDWRFVYLLKRIRTSRGPLVRSHDPERTATTILKMIYLVHLEIVCHPMARRWDKSKSAKVNEDEYRKGAIITKGRLCSCLHAWLK